jgi:signal transduction histidine kinase
LSAQTLREANAPASTLENNQLERQRQELDRLKNEFIAMVSHELRTPLTAIKGYAVLLQAYGMTDALREGDGRGGTAGEMTPARQREYLEIIMEQTSHLEVLISDLLDVSRIHAGRLALRCQKVDMAALCQRVVQLIQQRVDQQYPERYMLDCRLAPDLPLTWCDPDRVQQVLTNLLENAVKYSPDGGPIEVIVAPRPPLLDAHDVYSPGEAPAAQAVASLEPLMVYVTVRDQGIGISPDQHARLFMPFSRLEHARAGDVPGAGLGLYITHKLVEAMQGSVTLASRASAGTSVTFSLPVMLPPETSGSSQAPGSLPFGSSVPFSGAL